MNADIPAQGSSRLLIPLGLGIAMLGAAAVSVLVLGVSELYVGDYLTAALECAAGAGGLALFFGLYGRYLDRLEARAAARTAALAADAIGPSPESVERPRTPDSSNPVTTNVIIGLVGSANGLLILCAGLIWTQGEALVLNTLAGLSLTLASIAVWRLGRPRNRRERT